MLKTFVFKFGGASVKDASAIKNLAEILNKRLQNNLIIVISAIGKSTNGLELIVRNKFSNEDFSSNIHILKDHHLDICQELFASGHPIFAQVENLFLQVERSLSRSVQEADYDKFYDEIVSYGELLATRIVHEYLCDQQLYCLWQDVREIIVTDESHRFAQIDWEATQRNCKKTLLPKMAKLPIITQGFVGRSLSGHTTTLGREGSDFTAAILGNCLDARSVTIWKDVPGVLNADPKKFSDTILYEELDYQEAAEMTFYGASVIHPKTIKPLANKNIPLWVKSFLDPDAHGTKITKSPNRPVFPALIVKEEQILVTIKVTDFTFINEMHLQKIYEVVNSLKLVINLIQTSAITVSICMDRDLFKLEKLLQSFGNDFQIKYNEDLKLLTILHYSGDLIKQYEQEKNILVEQRTRNSYQIVFLPNVQ